MKQNCLICKVAGLLVALGGLNWGLVGIFQLDLVSRILGEMSTPTRVVYALIGVATLMKILSCFKDCPACKK